MLLNLDIFSQTLLAFALEETNFISLLYRFARWHRNLPAVITLRLLDTALRLRLRLVVIMKALFIFLVHITDLLHECRVQLSGRRYPYRDITFHHTHTHAIAFFIIVWSVDSLILVLRGRLAIILRVHSFA